MPAGIQKRPAAKKVVKRPAGRFNAFPIPKRGKGRLGQSRAQSVKGPYVRHGVRTNKSRTERTRWARNIKSFVGKREPAVVKMLIADGILLNWKGRACPHCNKGKLGPMFKPKGGRGVSWRCNDGRDCGKHVRPTHLHPVFNEGNGQNTMQLAEKASMLFCSVAGLTTAQTHLLLGVNHKAIEAMHRNLDFARKAYVERVEKNIEFGGSRAWRDCEADESVFRAKETEDGQKEWEQWAGVVERGRPDTLCLWRTRSDLTDTRAPGPGAIKKCDWKPFLAKRLENRRIALHSDGARSYRLRAAGVVHDRVVHSKKRVKRGGKWVWLKPKFSKRVTHTLPNGSKLVVKAGTQIIDRAWQFIKRHIGSRTFKPRSPALAARVRSAQWCYWNKGKDQWRATGDMLRSEMERVF